MPAMPIADSSAPIVVGMRHTSSATSTMIDCSALGVDGERLQRHDREQEDDREPGQQDVERDLVRRLLPVRPSTRAIIRSRNVSPGFDVMLHDDLVGEHTGAAGDGRAVAARLADHRRGLAGDRRLVDDGDALDDVAVAGDHLAGRSRRTRRRARAAVDGVSTIVPSGRRMGDRLGARLAQRVGLGLAAAFGHRLGEVGEQHREPQPQRRRGR